MTLNRRQFAGSVAAASALIAGGALHGARTAAQQGESIAVSGAVANPRTFSVSDLETMAQRTVTVGFPDVDAGVPKAYTGPLLADLVLACEPTVDDMHVGRAFVLVTGSDDYQSVFAWAEIAPNMGQAPIVLALTQDESELPADFGPAWAISPHDVISARSTWGVISIELIVAGEVKTA